MPRTPGDTSQTNDRDTGVCDDTDYVTQQTQQEQGDRQATDWRLNVVTLLNCLTLRKDEKRNL